MLEKIMKTPRMHHEFIKEFGYNQYVKELMLQNETLRDRLS